MGCERVEGSVTGGVHTKRSSDFPESLQRAEPLQSPGIPNHKVAAPSAGTGTGPVQFFRAGQSCKLVSHHLRGLI